MSAILFDWDIISLIFQALVIKTRLLTINGNKQSIKDGLYAGYCVAIPIPGCWYWYSIGGIQKSSIPNTRPIPKFYPKKKGGEMLLCCPSTTEAYPLLLLHPLNVHMTP